MPASRIVELASIISMKTNQIDEYLSAQGLPPLSFEPTEESQQYTLPDNIKAAQNEILEATDELHAHMLGPMGILNQQLRSCNQLTALHAINRFQIAEKFPKDKDEVTYAELSQTTGLPEPQLRRLLRQAMTQRIFAERTEDTVAHTAASKALTKPYVYERIGTTCEELWPAATKTVPALAKWPGSQEPTHSGFNLENQTDAPLFDHLAAHPARAARFAGAMSHRTTNPGDRTYTLELCPPLFDSALKKRKGKKTSLRRQEDPPPLPIPYLTPQTPS